MLHELRKVIPSFLRRVDLPDRGGAWTTTWSTPATATADVVEQAVRRRGAAEPRPAVTLVDWDPDGEDKLLAACRYAATDLPEHQLLDRVRRLVADERVALLQAYVGERTNRRHKPGRAFERIGYRFDVLSDYGAFRDLQRHRLLTIEWQRAHAPPRLRPCPSWSTRPGARGVRRGDGPLGRASTTRSSSRSPSRPRTPSAWPTGCATSMQLNAREAMHLLELRSAPQGHPAYRRIARRCTA